MTSISLDDDANLNTLLDILRLPENRQRAG
jgi:hypothetical protein